MLEVIEARGESTLLVKLFELAHSYLLGTLEPTKYRTIKTEVTKKEPYAHIREQVNIEGTWHEFEVIFLGYREVLGKVWEQEMRDHGPKVTKEEVAYFRGELTWDGIKLWLENVMKGRGEDGGNQEI